MRTATIYSLIFFMVFPAISVYSQSQTFKAVLLIKDGSIINAGSIVFPPKRDTVYLTDTAVIDLTIRQNRIFYFDWGGWKSKVFRFDSDCADDSVHKVSLQDTIFYKHHQQIHLCPVCLKSNSLIPIVYGFSSSEMVRQARHNIIRLGGCLVWEIMPLLYCRKDDLEF